jgi:hypothetical protein
MNENNFTTVFLRLLWCCLDVRALSIVPSGQVGHLLYPYVMSSLPLHSLEGCFRGQQDEGGFFPSWLTFIFFPCLAYIFYNSKPWDDVF